MNPRGRHHLWHPDILGIFQAAQAQRSSVTLRCHLRLDAANEADVALHGGITAVSGQVIRFRAEGYDFSFSDHAPKDPACAYAFALDLPRALRDVIRVEYEGRATILERELGRNNLPKILDIRVSLPARIRRRRRHDRIPCGPGRVEDAALALVEAPPRRRCDLERLLDAPSAGREAPRLLNLSVSGVCLLAGEAIRQKLMAAQERYLLSFVPCIPGRAPRPLVFLGRKVGVYPRPGGSAALRIRFCDELDAGAPGEELRWLNIERNGSAALFRVFRRWQAMDAEAALAAREAERAAPEAAEDADAGEGGAVTPGLLPVSFPDEDL